MRGGPGVEVGLEFRVPGHVRGGVSRGDCVESYPVRLRV